jgi:hypothetical protein
MTVAPEDTSNWARCTVEDEALREGFVQVPVSVFRDRRLTAVATRLYGSILWHVWKYDGRVPDQAGLAGWAGVSRKTVSEGMAQLVKHGYIEVKRVGLGKPNELVVKRLRLADSETPPCNPRGLHLDVTPMVPGIMDKTPTTKRTNRVPAATSAIARPLVAVAKSDSDSFRAWAETTATALGRPGEAKQLATWARKLEIPAYVLQAAAEVTQQQAGPLQKPVAYLQTVAKVMAADRQAAAEVGKRKQADTRKAALAYGREVFAAPVIGGRWEAVASIVAETYGAALAGAVVAELRGAIA